MEIMDTTLRDGEQTSGVSFAPHEKLGITRMMIETLGVNRVEVASARVSDGESDAVKRIVEWAKKAVSLGAGEILLTSMDADGTKNGYDCALTRAVSEAVGVPVIASGGAGKLEHLSQVLTEGKADAVLAASIFHFGTYTIPQAKQFLRSRGIPVRL